MGWVLPILPRGQGTAGWAQQERLSLGEAWWWEVGSCSPPAGAFAPSLLLQLTGGTHM